jgi:hypothetical protein
MPARSSRPRARRTRRVSYYFGAPTLRLALARMTALKQKAEQVKNLAAYPHTEYQANKIVAEFKTLAAEIEAEFKRRG